MGYENYKGAETRTSLLDRIPVVKDMDSDKRKGALASVTVHLVALALTIGWAGSPPPPLPGTPTNLTVFDIGIPSNGIPTGDDSPPLQAEDVQEEEAQPEVEGEEEEVERVDPDSGEEEDQSTTPSLSPEESDVTPEDAAPAADQDGGEQNDESAEPQTTVELPSNEVGTGTLAVGATTHGDATGLDSTLSAVIGQAVATRMGACWKPPADGVPLDAYSQMVIRYSPKGEFLGVASVVRLVNQQEVEIDIEADGLNEYEASAEDALRRCSPLGLPSSLYVYWKEVEIQLFGAPPPPLTTER